MTLYTVPTTGVYRAADGDSRYFVAGDVIDMALAVKFGMPGAAVPPFVDTSAGAQQDAIVALQSTVPGDIQRGTLTAALGDSIVLASGGATAFGGDSFFTIGCLLAGGRIRPYVNAGVAGENTTQILARVQSAVIAVSPKPAKCIVLGGTNDAGQGVAPAVALANLATIYDRLRAAGIEPIGATIPPRSDGFHPAIAQINAGVKGLCERRGMHCLDFHPLLTDPANGNYLAGYSADGIHPIAPGRRAMANLMATKLAPLYPLNPPYLTDDTADPINLVANGTMVDANVDGTADAWTLGGSGGTVTPTIVTGDANIVGNWQQFATTVAGQRTLSQSIAAATAAPKGWAIGDVMQTSGVVDTSAGIEAGASAPNVRIDFTGGTPGVDGALFALAVDLTRGVFYRRFVVPPGTTAMTYRLFNTVAAGNGTGTCKFAQVTLLNLTRLGVA